MELFELSGKHRDGLEDHERYYASVTMIQGIKSIKFLMLINNHTKRISIGIRNGDLHSFRPSVIWIPFDDPFVLKLFVETLDDASNIFDFKSLLRPSKDIILAGLPKKINDFSCQNQIISSGLEERDFPLGEY